MTMRPAIVRVTLGSVFPSSTVELDLYPGASEDHGAYAAIALRTGAAHVQFYATPHELRDLGSKLIAAGLTLGSGTLPADVPY